MPERLPPLQLSYHEHIINLHSIRQVGVVLPSLRAGDRTWREGLLHGEVLLSQSTRLYNLYVERGTRFGALVFAGLLPFIYFR